MKLLRMPGRFEWKILSALFIVAAVPLGAAVYLTFVTIGRIQVITEQHQEAVQGSVGGAVDVYRAYFGQMKETFRERADEIGREPLSSAAELGDVPELLRARILVGARVVDEWSAPREVLDQAQPAPPNLVALTGGSGPSAGGKPAAGEPRLLELTFGIPHEVYANFQALLAAMEKERDLDRLLPLVLPRIFRGLGVALVAVLTFATVLGLFVARRATGRVATLREAARAVGEGDLTVRVAPKGSDELDELGRAFDRMVAELAEARSRLGYLQKVSAWQEVARRLAHEIKNPLTPIQLAVQELASKYRGGDPDYERLLATAQEILNEEVGTIRRLVDDFSAFAKLPKVTPEPVDLVRVVEDFARAHPEWQEALRIQPAAGGAGGSPGGDLRAMCDKMLVRRVLANLVENAVQAAESIGRTPEARVGLALDARAGTVRITVDDNGPGVPPEARERIFDPYVTTKENGTGLGLSIVRKIVLDHGGDVRVAAAPSPAGGARFVVTLPAVSAASATTTVAPGKEATATTAGAGEADAASPPAAEPGGRPAP
jgi:two-component system nitrogen regulation sensor histidine kinase NtrY